MDFLAGAMVGFAASTMFFMCFMAGIVGANASRMKRLEEIIADRTRKETWDDADYWKRGYESDDEI